MNLAEMLFEDIVFSRIERNVLLVRFLQGWARFYFKNGEVFVRVKRGQKFSRQFSLEIFLKVINHFLLRGEMDWICEFLRQINLRKNRGLKEEKKLSKRSNNIAKELVMNFLLYRLGYESRMGIEISLDEKYQEKIERGHFYLAQRLFPPIDPEGFSEESEELWDKEDENPQVRREKDRLGGYIFSLMYCFAAGQGRVLKVHLPHLNIHRIVREALANLGLKIG